MLLREALKYPAMLSVFVAVSCVGPRWRTIEGEAVSGKMLKDCSQFSFLLGSDQVEDQDSIVRAATVSRASCPREDWIKVAPAACMAVKIGCSDVVMTEFESHEQK